MRCGRVEIEIADPAGLMARPEALATLIRQVEATLAEAGRAGSVRVRLVDDARMASAHQKYSGVEGTTDVLTFDLRDGASVQGSPLDVDILLCVDEARRQAQLRAHEIEREVLLYIIHGILHCLGHDDHDPVAAARMHAEEDRILEAIGIGPVFARAPVSDENAHGGAN